MTHPLVSIITPCYNGEKFLDTYFSSILKQTYPNLEVILVNDGSTDRSDEIICAYKSKLQEKNIKFTYILKENGGQMKAVNDGLKQISGEYFTWPDVDDRMHEDYIEKKVSFFLNNPDTDILITPCEEFYFDDKNKVVNISWKKGFKNKDELIDRFIFGKDAGYMPGAYMVKTKTFFKIYPEREIFCGIHSGVAIPMAFPLIFHGNARYLDEKLYDYYLHPAGQHIVHARRDYKNLALIYKNVLEQMHVSEKEYDEIMHKVINFSEQLLLGLEFRDHNVEEFNKRKLKLKKSNGYRLKDRLKSLIISHDALFQLFCKVKKW